MKFLAGIKNEFQKITWPSKKETTRLTGIVIGVSLSIGLFVTILDYVFTGALSFILK